MDEREGVIGPRARLIQGRGSMVGRLSKGNGKAKGVETVDVAFGSAVGVAGVVEVYLFTGLIF